jgi:hypothetical protein
MATAVLINSNIPNLKLLSKGKVRDIYATSSPEYLLFVESDRISAYDVILKNVNSLIVALSSPYSHSPTFTSTIVLPIAIKGYSGQGPRPDGTFALLVRQAEKHRSEPRRDFAHRRDAGRVAQVQGAARGPLHPREESGGYTPRGDRTGLHHR